MLKNSIYFLTRGEKSNDISTTPNEVKKPRISDSGEGCFKALDYILSLTLKFFFFFKTDLKCHRTMKSNLKKNYTVQNLKDAISEAK
ncbi:hypothetical protein BpHYR1_002310 [Brachionus plicatilis]|uniref:Uncharacterized protein n=1 Tax=Brachionus plicatilis TaxID=10195 RepID=A0A3M7RV14_BRAPC|nr:hypothetical protein BpHYR1_002310 [Brachionus plicatilis]